MNLDLVGKRVLVTGALGGIGLATVSAFQTEGARVVATDLTKDNKFWGDASDVTYLPAELRNPMAVQTLVDAAEEALGGAIDICVNNAAITHRSDFLEMEWTDFDRVYEINLRAPFLVGQAVARKLVGCGSSGNIINIGSVNAQLALPDNAAYVASKGGLLQLTRSMAIALAPHRIRVNMVAPGSIDTPLQRAGQSRSPELKTRVLSRTPLGRLGKPKEIADAVLYMSSVRSSYITGECLFVDGGRLPLNLTVPVPNTDT
jgi:NAD(P)-dependent dehydrogenase (short-subunit alcohol dehydrogenase family)